MSATSALPWRRWVLPTVAGVAFATAGVFAAAVPAGAACDLPGRSAVAAAGWPQARYDLDASGEISRGDGVTVAVLDSGVDPAHPQLSGAVRAGGDYLGDGGDGLEDCVGHGTAVASII